MDIVVNLENVEYRLVIMESIFQNEFKPYTVGFVHDSL